MRAILELGRSSKPLERFSNQSLERFWNSLLGRFWNRLLERFWNRSNKSFENRSNGANIPGRTMMKFLKLAFALAAAFGAGAVFSQSMLDPVKAAPHIYELVFENDRVRVLKRLLRKGETSPLVSQPDRVIVYLNPCAWLEDDGEGGKRMQSFGFGEPDWAPAGSHGGTNPEVVETCHIVEVELK